VRWFTVVSLASATELSGARFQIPVGRRNTARQQLAMNTAVIQLGAARYALSEWCERHDVVGPYDRPLCRSAPTPLAQHRPFAKTSSKTLVQFYA
jgi:hypothetical protein